MATGGRGNASGNVAKPPGQHAQLTIQPKGKAPAENLPHYPSKDSFWRDLKFITYLPHTLRPHGAVAGHANTIMKYHSKTERRFELVKRDVDVYEIFMMYTMREMKDPGLDDMTPLLLGWSWTIEVVDAEGKKTLATTLDEDPKASLTVVMHDYEADFVDACTMDDKVGGRMWSDDAPAKDLKSAAKLKAAKEAGKVERSEEITRTTSSGFAGHRIAGFKFKVDKEEDLRALGLRKGVNFERYDLPNKKGKRELMDKYDAQKGYYWLKTPAGKLFNEVDLRSEYNNWFLLACGGVDNAKKAKNTVVKKLKEFEQTIRRTKLGCVSPSILLVTGPTAGEHIIVKLIDYPHANLNGGLTAQQLVAALITIGITPTKAPHTMHENLLDGIVRMYTRLESHIPLDKVHSCTGQQGWKTRQAARQAQHDAKPAVVKKSGKK